MPQLVYGASSTFLVLQIFLISSLIINVSHDLHDLAYCCDLYHYYYYIRLFNRHI